MPSAVAGPSTASTAPASDDDVQMLDPPIATNGDGAPASPSAALAISTVLDADSPNADEPEDEYEIEYIVSHSNDMTDGQLSYFVKWKGYPDTENSWVFESDMGGAQEMIREYWDKVPKKNIKKMGAKKGGKRQSSLQAGSPDVKSGGKNRGRRESSLLTGETPLRKSGLRKGLAPSRSPTPPGTLPVDDPALNRIRTDPTLTEDQRELLESQHLHSLELARLRKRYARIPDWDPIVRKIEAVERLPDGKLRVFVLFDKGDRLAFDSATVHHRCPLKLLAYYEEHLRFKRREEGEGERSELRGEEPMDELEAYQKENEAEAQGGEETVAEEETGETAEVKGREETVPVASAETAEETVPAEAQIADEVAETAAAVDAAETS